MADFRAYLVEGSFHEGLICLSADGTRYDIRGDLQPFLGQRVRLAAHHLPSSPPDLTRPGAGSCHSPGTCSGHTKDPTWLFNFSEEGHLLEVSPTEWVVERLDGTRTPVPLGEAMPGHHGRVAVATAFSVEHMRDVVGSAGLSELVGGLGGRLQDLQDVLRRVWEARGR